MLLGAFCHGVVGNCGEVGNLCNIPEYKQAGSWGEKQNQKFKRSLTNTQ